MTSEMSETKSCDETETSTAGGVTLQYDDGALPSSAPQWAIAASERLRIKREQGLGKTAIPPDGVKRVLLHSCCAPCSGAMVEEMNSCDLLHNVTVFFYNPNIHPRKEYMIRKEENKKFCERLKIPFVDCDYDPENWYSRMKGMEYDPERGHRCTECFDMRMERCALYAHEHNFDAIATTNATSRWKDVNQVDDSGERAASRYPNIKYWSYDWQSDEVSHKRSAFAIFALCAVQYC